MCIVNRHRSSQRTVDVWPRKIKTNLHLVTWSVFAEITSAQIFPIVHLFQVFSRTLVTSPIIWINDISAVFFNFYQPVFSNIFVSQNYYVCYELKQQIVCFKREWLKTKELDKKQWRPTLCHCLSVIMSWIINRLCRKSNARKTMIWKY